MPIWKRISVLLLVILLIIFSLHRTDATVDSCSATVGPNSVNPDSIGPLFFTIVNSGSTDIHWIKITAPNANFSIIYGQQGAWSANLDGNSVVYTNGTLGAGSTGVDYIVQTSFGAETASTPWTVETSDAADGSNPTTCTGSSSVAIASGSPAISSPEVSEVTATVSGTSVALTFTTNVAATSTISYGVTDDYGSSKSESPATTNHSVALTSLLENTTYHYYIITTSEIGITFSSEDLTFTTSTNTSTSTTTTSSSISTVSSKADLEAPKTVLKTSFKKPFKDSPLISGTASDDIKVTKVEYSLDGGKNWLNVKITEGASVNFSFKPRDLEDGNYELVIRATDKSSKTSEKSAVLIIDKLPPSVGGVLFNIGPQTLYPNNQGLVFGLENLPVKLTMSALGGPTELKITSKDLSFPLTKNSDTGLWSGEIVFEKNGIYSLSAKGIDGAGNETTRNIGQILINSDGVIQSESGENIKGATVTLHTFDEISNQYIVWDGSSFNQDNPQITNDLGKYKFLPPRGKYYLELHKTGYKNTRSKIFEIEKSIPVSSNITIEKGSLINTLLGFTGIFDQEIAIEPKAPEGAEFMSEIPEETTDLLEGQRGVIVFLNTWLPSTSEVLSELEKSDIPKVVVMPQESQIKLDIFRERGRYLTKILSDYESEILRKFKIAYEPAYFFVNADGSINSMKLGILNSTQLIEGVK
jgi:hypothetical protein